MAAMPVGISSSDHRVTVLMAEKCQNGVLGFRGCFPFDLWHPKLRFYFCRKICFQ
jgi:hypothetical protein